MMLTPSGLAAAAGRECAAVLVVMPAADYEMLYHSGLRFGRIPGVLPAWLAWCAAALRAGRLKVDKMGCVHAYTDALDTRKCNHAPRSRAEIRLSRPASSTKCVFCSIRRRPRGPLPGVARSCRETQGKAPGGAIYEGTRGPTPTSGLARRTRARGPDGGACGN